VKSHKFSPLEMSPRGRAVLLVKRRRRPFRVSLFGCKQRRFFIPAVH
jgi:hypothetical protein